MAKTVNQLQIENRELRATIRAFSAIFKVYEAEIPLSKHPELNQKIQGVLANYENLQEENTNLRETVRKLQADNAQLILKDPPPALCPFPAPPIENSVPPPPVFGEQFPRILKTAPRWAVWYSEAPRQKTILRVLRDNTWHRKIKAASNNPQHWVNFNDAFYCLRRSQGNLHGLAFALGDVFCGFDFDRCIVDGNIHPKVQKWLNRLEGYQEVSQSGLGIKTIHLGALTPQFLRTARTGRQFKSIPMKGMTTEIYDKGRWFSLTGLGTGNPTEKHRVITEICYELQAAKDAMTPKPKRSPRPVRHAHLRLSDTTILEKVRNSRQADKFNSLWNGDIAHYDSHSEADLALTSILAWWCNYDMAQVERLFSQSELAKREKWDREDYRQRTLSKCMRGEGYQIQPLSDRQRAALQQRKEREERK